jgi:hypothetical protein
MLQGEAGAARGCAVHMHHSLHDDDSRHGDMAGGAEHHLAVLSPLFITWLPVPVGLAAHYQLVENCWRRCSAVV